MSPRRNPELRGLAAGGGLLVAGLLLMLLPSLAGMDGMSGGYALGLVGLVVVIVGVVTAAICAPRAARLNAILSGQHVLADWSYEAFEIEQQVDRDRRALGLRNAALFFVMAGWMLACVVLFAGAGYLSGRGDDVPLFLAIMAAVLLVLAAFAFGMPHLLARQALHSDHRAIIALEGLYFNGAFHIWSSPMSRLDGVELIQDADGVRLAFRIQAGRHPACVMSPTRWRRPCRAARRRRRAGQLSSSSHNTVYLSRG